MNSNTYGASGYVVQDTGLIRTRPMPWSEAAPMDSGGGGITGSQGPQGFQGAQGDQGPQGLTGDQGLPGAQGDQGFQGGQGTQGPQGVPGKGSFVKTSAGIYEFICTEGARPWFIDIIPRGKEISEKFRSAVDMSTAIWFTSQDGKHDLIFAVKAGFKDWYLEDASEEQRNHAIKFWNQEYLPR